MPLLAILPAAVYAAAGGRRTWDHIPVDEVPKALLSTAFIFVYVLACGAAITSLGLVATWNSRPVRALISCVGIYLGVFFGLLFFSVALFRNEDSARPLLFGNPFFAMAGMTHETVRNRFLATTDHVSSTPSIALWIAIYLAIALILYRRTLSSFDRCLGRLTKQDSGGHGAA